MSDVIGQWCARFDGDRQLTLWHKVESEIADRMVTKCGREMHLHYATADADASARRKGVKARDYLLVQAAPNGTRCLRCA